MYAFNKRFRPTLWGGVFVIQTLACFVMTLLLWMFAVGAWLQAEAPLLSSLLILASLITLYLGIDAHRNKDRMRLLVSISYGRRDAQLCPLELGRGNGLSE